MKKIRILLFASIVFGILALSLKGIAESDGTCDSPLVGGHTGAPGEPSCTGCHGGVANTGRGKLWFQFDLANSTLTYIPGQIYTCRVKIKQNKINKYGFVALALRNSDNTTIGKFGLINMSTTRLYMDGNRNYVSHTPCGADFSVNDTGMWTFTWQAPQTNVGPIKLYVSALAANHDHALTGDSTYTTSLLLNPASSSINETEGGAFFLKIYPNPVSDMLNVSFTKAPDKSAVMRIIDIQGNVLQSYTYPQGQSGVIQQTIILKGTFKKAIYFLTINDGENMVTRKINTL